MRISLASTVLILHRGDDLLGSCYVTDAPVLPIISAGGCLSPARRGFYQTTAMKGGQRPPRACHTSDCGQRLSPRISSVSSTRLHSLKGRFSPKGPAGSLARLRGGGGGTGSNIAPLAPPPLMSWIGPALSCGLSYALYNLFIKRASSLMDPMLGGVLLQVVAAVLGSCLWLVTSSRSAAAAGPPLISRGGIGWSVAAGVSVGLAEILSFVISSRGVPAMKSIPIVVGGSVWFGTILAAVWLRERVSWRGWVGVALISVGVALVGMDPSSSAAGH
jgi:bacterial/archaeal transporter family protein